MAENDSVEPILTEDEVPVVLEPEVVPRSVVNLKTIVDWVSRDKISPDVPDAINDVVDNGKYRSGMQIFKIGLSRYNSNRMLAMVDLVNEIIDDVGNKTVWKSMRPLEKLQVMRAAQGWLQWMNEDMLEVLGAGKKVELRLAEPPAPVDNIDRQEDEKRRQLFSKIVDMLEDSIAKEEAKVNESDGNTEPR